MRYQVIFSQSGYEAVDYETDDINQAYEVMYELQGSMYLYGERDFYYYIKEID